MATPWTSAELAESQNYANQYYSSHGIPADWGTPQDLNNAYLQARNGGSSHAEAMAAMDRAGVQMGWSTHAPAAAPAAPTAPDPTTPPPDTGTGGGSSGGGGGASAPGWTAPQGPPSSGFGAAPPVYQSDPNAPQFQPLPAYQAPLWTGGDFVNPSEEDLKSSPGYQARLDALIKTKTRQAAAQGTVLNGGTLTALDRAGQDYASNEYQTYRNNALDAYKQRYSQFQDAAGMNLAARTLNANENQATFTDRTNTYNTSNARTLSDYLTNVTAQRNAELDYWGRLKDVNNTGADLAGSSYRV